jgi:hypothetical protein
MQKARAVKRPPKESNVSYWISTSPVGRLLLVGILWRLANTISGEAGSSGDTLSTSGVAGPPTHSLWPESVLWRHCEAGRPSKSFPRRGGGQWPESGIHHCALPSSNRSEWKIGRLWWGTAHQNRPVSIRTVEAVNRLSLSPVHVPQYETNNPGHGLRLFMRLRCEKLCVFQKCAGSRPGTSGKQWDLTAVHAGPNYLIPRLSFSTVHFDWTTSPSVDGMVRKNRRRDDFWLGRRQNGFSRWRL